MRSFAVVLVIVLAPALAACGGIDLSRILTWPSANWADPNNYDAVRGKIEHDYDAGRGRMTVTGPVAYGDNDVFGHSYFLRAVLKDDEVGDPPLSRVTVLQIYVIASLLPGHANLDRASSGGRTFDVTDIYKADIPCARAVCPVRQDVGINITMDDLARFAAEGLDVTLTGKRGRIALDIPAPYFRAFRDQLSG